MLLISWYETWKLVDVLMNTFKIRYIVCGNVCCYYFFIPIFVLIYLVNDHMVPCLYCNVCHTVYCFVEIMHYTFELNVYPRGTLLKSG